MDETLFEKNMKAARETNKLTPNKPISQDKMDLAPSVRMLDKETSGKPCNYEIFPNHNTFAPTLASGNFHTGTEYSKYYSEIVLTVVHCNIHIGTSIPRVRLCLNRKMRHLCLSENV